MLAGVTAIVRRTRPMPAARRVAGIKMPAAPSNSNTPLTSTAALGQGMAAGTMRISISVAVKCAMPPIKNHRHTAVRPMRFNIRDAMHPPGNNPDPSNAVAPGGAGAKSVPAAAPARPIRAAATVGFAVHRRAPNTPRHGFLWQHPPPPRVRRATRPPQRWRWRGLFAEPSPRASALGSTRPRPAPRPAWIAEASAPKPAPPEPGCRAQHHRRIPAADRARPAIQRAEFAAPPEYPAAGCRRGRRAQRLPPQTARPAPPGWLCGLRENQALALL